MTKLIPRTYSACLILSSGGSTMFCRSGFDLFRAEVQKTLNYYHEVETAVKDEEYTAICSTCFGEGKVAKKGLYQTKPCPTCKGKNSALPVEACEVRD